MPLFNDIGELAGGSSNAFTQATLKQVRDRRAGRTCPPGQHLVHKGSRSEKCVPIKNPALERARAITRRQWVTYDQQVRLWNEGYDVSPRRPISQRPAELGPEPQMVEEEMPLYDDTDIGNVNFNPFRPEGSTTPEKIQAEYEAGMMAMRLAAEKKAKQNQLLMIGGGVVGAGLLWKLLR